MDLQEFQRKVEGTDTCDHCGSLRALALIRNFNINIKLLEIYPKGKPELLCYECVNQNEQIGIRNVR